MKFLMITLLSLFAFSEFSLAKAKTRTPSNSGDAKNCEAKAREEGAKALKQQELGQAALLNEPILHSKILKNGSLYVFAAYMEKVFTYEFVVVVDQECIVQSTVLL
jgi:hypothetical protein